MRPANADECRTSYGAVLLAWELSLPQLKAEFAKADTPQELDETHNKIVRKALELRTDLQELRATALTVGADDVYESTSHLLVNMPEELMRYVDAAG